MRGSEREGAWEGRWGSEPFLMTCLRGAQSEERGEKGQSEHKQQQYSAFSQRVGISLRPVIFVSGLFVVRLLSLALLLLLLCLGGWLLWRARVGVWLFGSPRSLAFSSVVGCTDGCVVFGRRGIFLLVRARQRISAEGDICEIHARYRTHADSHVGRQTQPHNHTDTTTHTQAA